MAKLCHIWSHCAAEASAETLADLSRCWQLQRPTLESTSEMGAASMAIKVMEAQVGWHKKNVSIDCFHLLPRLPCWP